MAVTDTWHRRDGSRSAAYGRGLQWRARWHDQSRSFPSKKLAQAWEARVRSQAKKPKVQQVTVSVLLDRWLDTKKGLSPRGYRACLDAAGHVRGEFGDHLPQDLSREQVQKWLAGLTLVIKKRDKDGQEILICRPASASLRHKVLQALSGACALAEGPNPCVGVKLPKEVRRQARFLTGAELGQLARECVGYEVLIWFLGTTGLRIGEACALNVGDVDRRRGRVWVAAATSKSRRGRSVPVPPKVMAMLDLDRARDAPLFRTRPGSRVNKDHFRARHFSPAVERAGLGSMVVHDLRHTAVSLAIESGADMKVVQRMVGHASVAMTGDVYGHLSDRTLDDVARRMDGLIGGDSGGD